MCVCQKMFFYVSYPMTNLGDPWGLRHLSRFRKMCDPHDPGSQKFLYNSGILSPKSFSPPKYFLWIMKSVTFHTIPCLPMLRKIIWSKGFVTSIKTTFVQETFVLVKDFRTKIYYEPIFLLIQNFLNLDFLWDNFFKHSL